jgi:uncharacterized OsmC-like protein
VIEVATRIREACDRKIKAMRRRPSLGRGTAVTQVRLLDGLACEVREGPWRLLVDMSEQAGGGDCGPNPGVLGRGAFGTCLAINCAMWAARLGVPLASLDVEVQADYDARVEYGVEDGHPGYSEVRYVVTVASDAPEHDVMRVLDAAEAHASYIDVFRRPIALRGEVRVLPVEAV